MTALLLILATLIFVAYNVCVILRYGVPQSLSATYYTEFGRRMLVPVLVSLCVLLGIAGMSLVRDDSAGWVFLAVAGLAFVAATPLSRDSFDGKIHLAGAIASAIGTQGIVIANQPMFLLVWLLFPPLWLLFRKPAVLLAEILCFTSVIATMTTLL